MIDLATPLSAKDLRVVLDRLAPLVTSPIGHVDVCVFDAHDDEALLREVGRLREESFRGIGGGSQRGRDLDEHDFGRNPYQQLIVIDREQNAILGGCRFGVSHQRPQRRVASEELFAFSSHFRKDYVPKLIDIGRMFIPLEFQMRSKSEGTGALDHIFRGICNIGLDEKIDYFFGRVVFPQDFDPFLRDLTLAYLHHHFGANADWVRARKSEAARKSNEDFGVDFTDDARKDLRTIVGLARRRGGAIPALVRAYVAMSPTLRVFGTAKDTSIGGIEETCLMVHKYDIYPRCVQRWTKSAASVEKAA
ncbi:MAG: GNAT family N-acetyltransferase [Deltaproteobacteria bacterium]|nr:GNAT family N-acetyltransferase [Deltaproteobacteria bacterium]